MGKMVRGVRPFQAAHVVDYVVILIPTTPGTLYKSTTYEFRADGFWHLSGTNRYKPQCY